MKALIIIILLAGFGYLNYTTPSREVHEDLLYSELSARGVTDAQFEKIIKDVDYSNFMVCSATKTSENSKMISLGYLDKTKIINDKWVNETVEKLQGKRGN